MPRSGQAAAGAGPEPSQRAGWCVRDFPSPVPGSAPGDGRISRRGIGEEPWRCGGPPPPRREAPIPGPRRGWHIAPGREPAATLTLRAQQGSAFSPTSRHRRAGAFLGICRRPGGCSVPPSCPPRVRTRGYYMPPPAEAPELPSRVSVPYPRLASNVQYWGIEQASPSAKLAWQYDRGGREAHPSRCHSEP